MPKFFVAYNGERETQFHHDTEEDAQDEAAMLRPQVENPALVTVETVEDEA